MNKDPRRVLVAVGLAAIVLPATYNFLNPVQLGPEWSNDLSSTLERAKRDHRVVLVDFNASWCGPCNAYKREVFPSREFKEKSKGLLLVSIDVDTQGSVASKFGVSGIPDIRILSPDGKELTRLVGYDRDGLLKDMDRALSGKLLPREPHPGIFLP